MGKHIKKVQRRVFRAVLESLAEDHPDLYEELLELRRHNPQQYRKEIRMLVASGYDEGAFDEYEPLFIKAEGDRDELRAAKSAAKEKLVGQMNDALERSAAPKGKAKK